MTGGGGWPAFVWQAWRGPLLRRVACVLGWTLGVLYVAFVLSVLALRYVVLPQIDSYRPVLERRLADSLGLQVSIGRVEAYWSGLSPGLTLDDVRIADAGGRPALAFSRVETVLSWWSVPALEVRLRLLRIDAPTLHLWRDETGHFFVAGIPLAADAGDGGLAKWILAQQRIRISGASLVWDDALRDAGTLVLEDVNLSIDSRGHRHRFALTASPPAEYASRLDLRGDLRGNNVAALAGWNGQLFAQIDYADLAVWRRWIDYPIALPRGRGAVRSWLSIADGRVGEVTADLALRDVQLQLAPDLPAMQLAELGGRVQARLPQRGFSLKGRQLVLDSGAGLPAAERIRIEPVDFELSWQPGADDGSGEMSGSAAANQLDLGELARLAAYLPIDAHSRQLLTDYAPQGSVSGLSARWQGNAERLRSYTLKTGAHDLGMRARGDFPGFSGLSGTLEASEAGGKLAVHSGESTIDLPAVFPDSLTRLDTLDAQASWTIAGGELRVDLAHANFAGAELAGTARGVYRYTGEGPGTIDMSAELSRADARAVWRYLPVAVGDGSRYWLRDSLRSGKATEAKLILKGPLQDFPFVDKRSGQFLVTVKARDVVIDYANGWPRIDGVNGDLRFEGKGMRVEAQQGRILGAQLSHTQVHIPDFDAAVPVLYVKGRADGPTASFLRFIDQSPVAERIDRFTEDMRAKGNGQLDLDLTIPLAESQLDDSKVAGNFRFVNNEVMVDPVLPPLRQVNGSLRFSGSDLSVPEINASLFGGPLKIQGGLQKDGRVLITVGGSADMAQLQRQAGSTPPPALMALSGSTPYRGEIRIAKRNADVVVETNLVGIASSLPEPFAKAAGASLPLRFEKKLLASGAAADSGGTVRDQLSFELGSLLAGQVIRRRTADGFVPERGAIAVGRPLQLPEKGLALDVGLRRVDIDAWQKLFAAASEPESSAAAAPLSPWLPDALKLRADELVMRGMTWNDVDLAGTRAAREWRLRLDARQAAGNLSWDDAGAGRLQARLNRLVIDRLPEQETPPAPSPKEARLPALDVTAEDFSVRDMRFGRLEILAANEGAGWNMSRIRISNPHGTLNGSGSWLRGSGAGRTQLSFKLDSSDVGGLLARLGYPGSVRAGTAQLDGRLNWSGAPTDMDFGSLNGDLNVEAAKGQFLKLDPGAAGKLLGLISLQNLPRRITLDFKDVFSEGLAFDSLTGKLAVQRGVMRSDRLQIDGPAARVLMRGEVDLAHETQRLNVTVQPEVGDTAALGMAFVHPAAGVATWLASKVLSNPLGAVFGYNYLVTGTWDDPVVEKQGATTNGGGTAPR